MASFPKDQEPYLSIARQRSVDGVTATWFTQGDTNVYTLIVSSAAAVAAVFVGVQVVVWLGMRKVPDELNDLP